jgi:MFS transporter, YNFM family, putative membrane transport protein
MHTSVPASRPIVWIIGFFAFLNVYAMQAVLPLVMQDFGASPVQAGATVGATVLAIALVSPFMGMLSDALGRKRILCTAMLALSVPTALIPLTSTLHALVVLRFMQGLAVPGIVVVLIAYLGEEFRGADVARMTSTYVGGTIMGGFSGRFITGHAGEQLGWRGAFVLLAMLNLAGALLVMWRLPPSRHFVPHHNLQGGLQTLLLHLRNRRLLSVCALGFCVLFSLVGAFTYINLHLAQPPYSLTAGALANVFSVYLLGVVITPLAGRFIARRGFVPSVLTSLLVSATGLLLTLAAPLWLLMTGLTLCACGVFVCQTATISHIADTVKTGRSLATGIYYLSYYAGGAAGTALAGWAYEAWEWPGSVAAIVVAEALAGLLAWTFLREAPRNPASIGA